MRRFAYNWWHVVVLVATFPLDIVLHAQGVVHALGWVFAVIVGQTKGWKR